MTIDQFRSTYGLEYSQLVSTPMWNALLATIDEASPGRQSPLEPLPNVAGAGATLFAQCQGWELLRRFLNVTLTTPPTSEPSEETYTESPV